VTVLQLKGALCRTRARYLFAVSRIKRIIWDIKPDVVIGYRINSYGFLAVMSGFHPIVAVAQGSDLFYPVDSKIQKAFLRYVIKKADLLQTWGMHMSNKLIEYGADKEKLLVLPKGVDISIFKPFKEQIENRPFTMISTRQLRKSYNHECVLKAVPIILEKISNFQYLICGEGEYKSELESLVKQLGIERNVHFIGKVKHNELPVYLNSSDIYVSMQPSDGVSSSLLEAMACGVFPIVTDIEANRLWINEGSNGFIVPVNDYISLAKKLINAYENKELKLEAASRNISLIKERASMEHNMSQIINTYHKLIKTCRNGKDKRSPFAVQH